MSSMSLCVLLLCSLLPVANTFCYGKIPQPGVAHCKDDTDETWHAVGSSWRNSACMDCTCSGCCSAYSIPRSFPSDCEKVFDQNACEYRVLKKNDPSVECPIYESVGK
ncbi:beta-microseminoprotein-like [Cynoglossus semilaevis]|uniref:Beta-microseminoprotein-like n=1 Tax=Cynoglossus semilaevis TaxID=244447 RepID=A0A3P8WCT5_CYNSE|nr:beta-microseminoprotein-like [Cynoglossus semilaevis]